ncbi:MAG: trimethylamine methyltransferase family protein [Elusimicrobia bacterium]|nr:trimethylamine methyltransferase family protein [Elusimicrobiota bacterium]
MYSVNVRQPVLNFLDSKELDGIHYASLELLERTGLKIHNRECCDLLYNAGAYVENNQLVRIPSALVKRCLSTAPEKVTLASRKGDRVMFLEDNRVYFGTGSDLEFTLDNKTKEHRMTKLEDVKDASIVSDYLENIDFIMSYGLANDVDPKEQDIHQFLTMVKNTTKPLILTSLSGKENLEKIYKISCAITGGEDKFKHNPFWIMYGQFVSPFQHNEDALERLIFCADRHIPIIYVPTVMSGASGPVTMAGSLALGNAEVLGGLVIHQLRSPGAPFIYGGCITPFDMRTSNIPYGAPEWHMGSAIMAQLSRRYNLPIFGTGGCSDSKLIDEQAVSEATSSLLLEALSGLNLIHDVGYLESGLCGSLDFLVICNEVIAMTKRILKNFQINSDTLAIDLINEVGPGGHFMDKDHTLKHFKDGIWYPELFDRNKRQQWSNEGSTTMCDRAHLKLNKILSEHKVESLDSAVEKEINKIIK